MTDAEFEKWASRLFVQFPSLGEWLNRHSPDPMETQKLWRETLRQYRYDECLSVLARWADGGLSPFAAYERDQVASIVRSVVNRDRMKEAERESQREHLEAKRYARSGPTPFTIINTSKTMRAAFEELRQVHKGYLEGAMFEEEYLEKREAILDKV